MPLPYSLDLTRLQSAYATGALTPTRVVEDVLADVDATRASNPVWIDVAPREVLLAHAGEIEARRARGEPLPLYGVPFAAKDNIDVAGRPTTAACPAFAYAARASAHSVQRLEAAGALCIGKTNLDQFATGLVGTRSPYGACVNPFDARYISGGSSSGSAVAVAAGQVSFALGTDTAGSGRVPAGFCNIVGWKPTRGLLSTRGVVPACRTLDCVSIFALTVGDARVVFDLARGHDKQDPYSRADAPLDERPLARWRCGVPRASQLEFCGDALARDAFERALERLAAIGAELVEIDYTPFLETARLLYEGPWVAERLAAIGRFFDEHPDDLHPVTRAIVGSGRKHSAVDAFAAQYTLQALKTRCAAKLAAVDALAVPTAPTIYTHAQVEAEPIRLNTNLGWYTNFVNLLDLAAIAVPTGFRADGLPAGVTLIGPALEDYTLSRLADRLHRASETRLGATRFTLPDAAPGDTAPRKRAVALAVVGAHLSGMPLNHQLTLRGARLIESCATSAQYRLYALPGTTPPKPGLARVGSERGAAIEVELWSVPVEAFGSFVADVPPPLAIGSVTLADGRTVKGFVCEGYALDGARDISGYGGWRNYVAQSS
ncbi:MAG TPA: allophanate hydrolase [Burkholderiales bacterium]|nr:allophanate hydrolase [Burkholderiales bacterium]